MWLSAKVKTVPRQRTVRKDVPGVVDEHVDAGLLGRGRDLIEALGQSSQLAGVDNELAYTGDNDLTF
jgi:hypothetical protein